MASRSYNLTFSSEALQGLTDLSPEIQRRVLAKLVYFTTQADPMVFAAALKGHAGYFRFRIGDHRAIFKVAPHSIEILAVGPRKNIYLRLN